MLRLVTTAALTFVVACTTVDSDSILTSGIHAVIRAEAEGDGRTTVSTTLYLEDPSSLNFIELVGDDQLFTHGAGESKRMTGFTFLNIVTYIATFDTDLEDEEFIVELRRTVDQGAPESYLTLPAPLDLLFELEEVSREEEVVIGWDPFETADFMAWSVDGTCIDPVSGDFFDDPGILDLPAGTIVQHLGEEVPDECEVTVTITRSREGDLDPNYGRGGSIEATQTRSVSFLSVP